MNPVCISFVNRNSVWCSGDGLGVQVGVDTSNLILPLDFPSLPGDLEAKALIPGFLGRRREMSLSFPCGKVSFFFLSSSKPFLSFSKPFLSSKTLNPLLSEYQITEFFYFYLVNLELHDAIWVKALKGKLTKLPGLPPFLFVNFSPVLLNSRAA